MHAGSIGNYISRFQAESDAIIAAVKEAAIAVASQRGKRSWKLQGNTWSRLSSEVAPANMPCWQAECLNGFDRFWLPAV
jgi:hypothetical protein